jgi:hypothetical protein
MTDELKKAQFSFIGEEPMVITDCDDAKGLEATAEQRHTVTLIGKTIREYRNAARELLAGKYAHLREYAPAYLADPGNILAACCNEGVVIRFESSSEAGKVCSGWIANDLAEVAALLSQNLIHCIASGEASDIDVNSGHEVKLSSVNADGSHGRDLLSFRIGFTVLNKHVDTIPKPPDKPFCLASVRNSLILALRGERVAEDEEVGAGQHFLSRTKLRLRVGWDCIEIYPFTNLDAWNPDFAEVWAEKDILAAVAAQQFDETRFQSLDPNAAARSKYAELLREFRELLDSDPEREEMLQQFLKRNPALLCPTHTKMWPKLPLGAKETDFVFRDATSQYLLVELEKSTHSLFRKDGHAKTELNVAIGQIADWKRYLEDNLRTVQHELGLTGITANPRSLVVIGRSCTLSDENCRKLRVMETERPRLKIMTYDDVYNNATAVIENLLGPVLIPGGNTQIVYLDGK